MTKLEDIYDLLGKVESKVDKINGTVRANEREIAILRDWRASQVNTTLGKVQDMRVELAKMGTLGGTVGTAIGMILLIGKAVGVF